MNKFIDFYFDFISPYSYLAHKRIRKIQKDKKIKFIYKPIFLGGLHNLANITAPALIKSKKRFLIDDCEMVAKKFKIDFKFNEKFPINSLSLMRGMLIIDNNAKDLFIDSFFDAYWFLNSDLENKENVSEILKKINIDPVIFYQNITKQETKDNLKNITQQAFDKKIFGAPTFIVNNKIFWGQDRLDYALDEYNS
tara:strand:- start:1061 stop:1645 length:585 start_codon:yes stop_codon:yes gene_type:complete